MASSYDLLITANETNNHHGVGIYLQRLFKDGQDFICLRSTTMYGGEEPFGVKHIELKSSFSRLPEITARLEALLKNLSIRRILCVPYYRSEFIHAVIAKKITGAPLCTFIMDDQNIFTRKVPDHWVSKLLKASDFRLGISPELCAAYEKKYNCPMHLMPPLVEQVEKLTPCYWQPDKEEPLRAAMIGNVWTDKRFKQLRKLLRSSNLHIDWYGNGSQAGWLSGTPEEWETDKIRCLGHLPEEDLIASLASYPFVVIPSGDLDRDDDNPAFSRLSLPSRLIFLHARTDTPVLILGSPETAAGRFVTALGSGLCASYKRTHLTQQVAKLTAPSEHAEFRRRIRAAADQIVLKNGGQWIWDSLAKKHPQPANFQKNDAFKLNHTPQWVDRIQAFDTNNEGRPSTSSAAANSKAFHPFAFLRTSHLRLLTDKDKAEASADSIELSQFIQRTLFSLLSHSLPDGGNVLYLDLNLPDTINTLPAKLQIYRLADINAWQKSGFSLQSAVRLAGKNERPSQSPPQCFDAIISTGWLNNISADSELRKIAYFISRKTVSQGLNLHAFSAVLHPDYFWTGAAHAYLQKHFQIKHWPNLNDILDTPDLFTMSEAAYDKYWLSSIGKKYAEFGQPLGLMLGWRQPKRWPEWRALVRMQRWWTHPSNTQTTLSDVSSLAQGPSV